MPHDVTRITLASRPQGAPRAENFSLETATLPDPGEGEVLVRTIWLSLDPYMRGRMDDSKSYVPPVPLGGVMEGEGVAEVLTSNHPDFSAGDIVAGPTGWADKALISGDRLRPVDPSVAPIQTALGVLGMPGLTAWVGLNDIARGQSGETIVVSAATGAVGGVVGQLAKARGMKAIGVAGGPEKCAYAVETLGYDACLDHRSNTLEQDLESATPDGVDVYFENVGGKTLTATLPRMNVHGRIAVIGMIAWYSGANMDQTMPLPAMWRTILTRRLTVQGMIVFDHNDRRADFLSEVAPMVASGAVSYRETVADGLENAPGAFMAMLKGGNFGKQLVRVGIDP